MYNRYVTNNVIPIYHLRYLIDIWWYITNSDNHSCIPIFLCNQCVAIKFPLGGSSHLVSGLVHPSYKWINPTYPIYNWGYNPLTKWDEPPSRPFPAAEKTLSFSHHRLKDRWGKRQPRNRAVFGHKNALHRDANQAWEKPHESRLANLWLSCNT